MKIKFTTKVIVNILVFGFFALTLIVFTVNIYFLSPSDNVSAPPILPKSTGTTKTYHWNYFMKKHDDNVPDSMGYNKYNGLKDSIVTIHAAKNGEFSRGSGAALEPLLRTGEFFYCDTCSLNSFYNKLSNPDKQNIKYCLILPGWQLKRSKLGNYGSDSVVFFVEHDQAYLRRLTNLPDDKMATVNDIPVKFRYSTKDECLMIPVGRSTKVIITIIVVTGGLCIAGYVFYLFAAFLKLLIDLSKGYAFTIENVSRLKLISLSLIVYPIVLFSINLLFKLIFRSYFTVDVILKTDVWGSYWKMLIAGIIFSAFWKAFKQGRKLKEEQDLTV